MGARLIIGDALEVLRSLPDDSVDLVLTSPPFLALRSYLPADHPDKAREIGSEPTPGEFIDTLLDVVEECRRVLARHGSLVWELGDTYSGHDYGTGGDQDGRSNLTFKTEGGTRLRGPFRPVPKPGSGWPQPKSLACVPQLLTVALSYGFNPLTGRRIDPWIVRNVIRWVRPNPPVGALGDKFRPATSEMVVACTSRTRYFDLDAVREEPKPHTVKYPRNAEHYSNVGYDVPERGDGGRRDATADNPAGAPPLDWWAIPTEPFPGSHYATWPRELCVKPIKAMSPERVCRVCGEPSRRVVEATYEGTTTRRVGSKASQSVASGVSQGHHAHRETNPVRTVTSERWTECDCPGCNCDDHPVGMACTQQKWRNGVVLDPFAGSGTTLAVATGHGRDAIGIDLDERNADLAMQRVGMFLTVEHFNGPEPDRERPVVDVELPEDAA